MKYRKKICVMINTMLICTNLMFNVTNATIIEEDIEEMLIIESEDINDVDFSSIDIGKLRVDARNAIALDSKTKQVLFEQNASEIVPMASTTKILTALVAISYGDLEREVEISKTAASIRGSVVGYHSGEKIKMKELLFGLMFRSGNDAAIAIAEDIGGSIEGFADIMNHYAKSLGLVNSHFESPHGLDSSKHYTCAYDLALLTATAMENEQFCEICGQKTMDRSKYNFSRDYSNINKILYKIPNANGVKTGYTGQAGKCLVSSVNHEGRNIIIVVLNCVDRWNVTEKIYKSVEEFYDFKTISSNDIIDNCEYINLGSIIEDCEFDYGYKGEGSLDVEVFQPIYDSKKGDILGKMFFSDNNGEELIKKSLITNRNISLKEFESMFINESVE